MQPERTIVAARLVATAGLPVVLARGEEGIDRRSRRKTSVAAA